MLLYNKLSKDELKKKLQEKSCKRITLSFYRYVIIDNPQELRDKLYIEWSKLEILGRIYIAKEGINAQINVPELNLNVFKDILNTISYLEDIRLNIAVNAEAESFYKLIIKVKNKIVADGLSDSEFDVTNVGKHLSATEFNEAMEDPAAVVIDMRNHYESEVGHFKNAVCPDVDTFRESLPKVLEIMKDKKENKILLYCTGGIRCEKASAYFKHHGFNDVNQLQGGIVYYTQQLKQQRIESKFIGKNFVFDERLGERISEEIISKCHQCDQPCDTHINCSNDDCHLLFIQCESCAQKYNKCCTPQCQEIIKLPLEEQRKLRKGKKKENCHAVYKSRLRPNLRELLNDTKNNP